MRGGGNISLHPSLEEGLGNNHINHHIYNKLYDRLYYYIPPTKKRKNKKLEYSPIECAYIFCYKTPMQI